MPRRVRPTVSVPRTVSSGAAATVLGSWALGRVVQREPVAGASQRLYEFVLAHRSRRLARRVEVLTGLGDYPVNAAFVTLVGGMVAYQQRRWSPLPLLTGGTVAEILIQKLLKRLVHSSIPPKENSIGPPGDFPSGGAARVVIIFGLLGYLLGQEWDSPAERTVIWTVVGGLVAGQGLSRLYLGRHWPVDVVGGWVFGGLLLAPLVRLAAASAPAGRPAPSRR